MHPSFPAAALLAAAATLGAARAEPPRPDPLDPQASVPALHHRSAFGGYRPNVEQPVGSWKAANDTAAAAGGWRNYAREARAPAAPASAPASAPAPAGHDTHHAD